MVLCQHSISLEHLMTAPRSYTMRAILALSFLFLFYGLALTLAALLILVPYWEVTVVHRLHIKLTLLCLFGAGVILWSIVPRRNKWEAPGPLVTKGEQPRLFAIIEGVASQMGATLPDEVYLIPEVNAFVMQRGGFFGVGGKRVMGLGVPLLAVSQVSHLRAILAHEFGHYQGGETRLASIVYATRSAMIRTLVNLHRSGAAVLHKPFEWMLNQYLRITQAIARQQELAADEWAVRVAGKTAQAEALQSTGLHGLGFDLFIENELRPLRAMGVVPDNLFAGFRRFLHSSGWDSLRPMLREAMDKHTADPLDSHPPQSERLQYLETLPQPPSPPPTDPTPAYQLLADPEAIEVYFSKDFHHPGVQVVSWDNIGPTWAKVWRMLAERAQVRVPDLCPGRIAALAGNPALRDGLAEQISPRHIGYRKPDRKAQIDTCCVEYLSAYLGTVLADFGWQFHTAPGEPVQLQRGVAEAAERIHVRDIVRHLIDGELSGEDFLAKLSAWDVSLTAKVTVSTERQAEVRERRVPVLRVERGGEVEIETVLGRVLLPECCALCCGPAEHEVQINLQYNRLLGGNQIVQIPVTVCGEHHKSAHRAFKIKSLSGETGEVTLTVLHPPYAELIERCNA
jgi:heat shock protein HtpX